MKNKSSGTSVQSLRNRGFDESYYKGAGVWRVRCSQCNVMIINGVACHEHGCPNIPRESDEEDEYDDC